MSFVADVRLDIRNATFMLGALEREKNVAAVRGLNRAAQGARTDSVKALRPLYPSIKVAALRARIKVERATGTNLRSATRFSSGRIALHGNFGMKGSGKFGVRFGKLPYRVETLDGSTVDSKMMERAFRNRIAGGRAAVLARLGPPRLPISVLVAPAISKAVVEKHIAAAVKVKGQARFLKEFTQAVRALTWKRAGVI